MSAETLRKAAREMRHDAGLMSNEDAAYHCALADWLDEVAERQKPTQRYNRRSHGWTGARHANAVARAYLLDPS